MVTVGGRFGVPRTRWFASAVGVGFVARVVWVAVATTDPGPSLTDAASYARMAQGFASLNLPVIGDAHSAFYPPGYPLVVAPIEWLGRVSGWWGPYVAGSLVNVVLGTASIVLVAMLATRWIGPGAATVSAWLLAVSPPHVYFTSANLSETLLTTLVLAGLVIASGPLGRAAAPRRRDLVAFGLLVGFAILVKSSNVVLLAAPVLAWRAHRRRGDVAAPAAWRRSAAWVGLAAAVVLVPWAVRNGVQVGVWSPLSTNNASSLCIGNRDGASGGWRPSDADLAACYRGSPFDDPAVYAGTDTTSPIAVDRPDESRWYARASGDGVRWIARHPLSAAALVPKKVLETFRAPEEALHDGRNQAADTLGSPFTTDVLRWLAQWWHFATLGLAAVGLVLVPACQRATPLWGYAAGFMVTVVVGLGLPRYQQSVTAVAVVFAASVLVAVAEARGVAPETPLAGTVAP